MRNFSQFVGKKVQNIDTKILLIENIPKPKRTANDLKNFFNKKFPNCVITRITFVYDISKIMSLSLQLYTALEARKWCKHYQRRYDQRCEVRPYSLGNFRGVCCCCYCYPKVDGLHFYA